MPWRLPSGWVSPPLSGGSTRRLPHLFLYQNQGRYAEAEALYLATLETCKRVLGDEHPDTLWSMNNLAWFQLTREPADSRDPHAALKLALEVAEKTGYEDPEFLDTLSLARHLTDDTAKAIDNQSIRRSTDSAHCFRNSLMWR